MKTFRNFITELFDRPAKWRKVGSDEYYADINGDELYVDFDGYKGEYILNFKMNGKNTITGTGNEFLVFATVIDIVKDFIKKNNPTELIFSAVKNSGTEKFSRDKLYTRMIKNLAKSYREYDYSIEKSPKGSAVVYKIFKK